MLLVMVLVSYCLVAMTDVGSEVLEMCRRNVDANKHLQRSHSDSVHVRELDWMQAVNLLVSPPASNQAL